MTQRAIALITIFLTLALIAPVAIAQAGAPISAQAPVNPHASPEAQALLKYLYSISGKYTLTGQHNYPNTIARWTDRAYDLTGKYPAVYGQDFGFEAGEDKDSTLARPAMIEEAKRQWRNGAIPTLTWHVVRPTSDEPVAFRDNIQSHLTDFEWSELITPGTSLNNRWCAQVDVVAGYLKQLRDAHVPVLFRPYHEINGNWFWWSGRNGKNGSAALYRQIFDRFVNYHKLDNLIWVWNVNAPGGNAGPVADYFPGPEYVDVLSLDVYGEFQQSYYSDMLTLAAGKPLALGEVGYLPTLAVMKAQPNWTWFMVWSEWVEEANSLEALRAIYDAPNLVGRDDPRLTGAMAAIRKASIEASPGPVTPNASAEAKSLLARLYSVTGKNTLSGQENGPRSVSGSTANVFRVTTKHPAIYGADLGIPKEVGIEAGTARKAIVEEAKHQNQAHGIVSLTWRAARPSDDESASTEQSIRVPLTDFEWDELLTPGTNLNKRWCDQVDAIVASLKQLQDVGIPVLWRPYPQSNGKNFWWAGRKGIRGSAALYRQLFNRLTNHAGLHNLIWVWEAVPAGYGPDSGQYSDFFPGLIYVDALSLDVENGDTSRRDAGLVLMSNGKVIGLEFNNWFPDSTVFTQQPRWAWFLLSPNDTTTPEQSNALRKLYADPRVIAISGENRSRTVTPTK